MVGYACGGNGTLKTVDGGENWSSVSTSIGTTLIFVKFFTTNHGWASNGFSIY